MEKAEKEGNKTNVGGANFGCCNLTGYRETFKKMSNCFTGQSGSADCSSMKDDMMKKMKEFCCPPNTTDTQKDAEPKKSK